MYTWHEGADRGERQIFDMLCRLGLSANYAGFFQMACAVGLIRERPERLQMVTKWLYPEVARRCHTSWSAVERNLRTAVAVIWRQETPTLRSLVGYPLPPKPSNARFLSFLAMCPLEDGAA